MKHTTVLATLLLLAVACGRDEAPAPADTTADGGAAAAPADAPIAPMSSRDVPAAGGAAPGMAGGGAAAGIDYDLPAGWASEQPSSGMRLAQASIPGPGGPGQLVVFYFGPGGGGSVEANIERWVGQVEPAPGEQPERETFEANGFRVTAVDLSGTLLPTGMGMGPTEPQPDSRMIAAVVEGEGGPWYFKATGPEATLADQRDELMGLLKSVRPQ